MMSRKKIDLTRLPIWLQYLISITIVGIVVVLAYLIGKDKPIPIWIEAYLISILSWTFIVLSVSIIVGKIFDKSK